MNKMKSVSIVLVFICFLLVLIGFVLCFLYAVYLPILMAKPTSNTLTDGFPGPIDVVYTWVDGNDKAWKLSQDQWRTKEGIPPPPDASLRDPTPNLSKDELYFSIKSVKKYMPWVNRIYIFTQTPQKPHWYNPSDASMSNIFVVHHENVFASNAPLPSYNGLLNQSQVHRIPGLADHFILFDDDFFVGRPLDRGHFFDRLGNPVYRLNISWATWLYPNEPYSKIKKSTHKAVHSTVGRWAAIVNHLPVPLTRDDCFKTENLLARKGYLDNRSRFRGDDTFEFPMVVVNYRLACGQTRRHPLSFKTNVFHGKRAKVLKLLASKKFPHLFCINAGFDQEMADACETSLNFQPMKK